MTTSAELFDLASRHIPGGVNSPVRAFKGLHRPPVFMERAQGAYLFDVEGNRYVDYIGSWGPMITGHAIKTYWRPYVRGWIMGSRSVPPPPWKPPWQT